MFTGIIEDVGRIVERVEKEGHLSLTLEASVVPSELRVGASIAVSGVCLTVTELAGPRFTVDVSNETLDRTTLGGLATDDRVNLELPLRPDGRLDGHFVQGHVDGKGKVVSTSERGSDRVVRVQHPQESDRYIVEKGSIAIDGISLTVTACGEAWFEVMLIPHTLRVTTLGGRVPGDGVNLEYDILAKYLVRLVEIRQDSWRKD
jgi:riboflavin synthase